MRHHERCGHLSGCARLSGRERGLGLHRSNAVDGEQTVNQFDDDCDGQVDEGFVTRATGAYDSPSCGNCYTNCTQIFSKPQGYGACDTSGAPKCKLACCKVGSTTPGCDGMFDYFDLNGVPDDGCEFKLDTAAITSRCPIPARTTWRDAVAARAKRAGASSRAAASPRASRRRWHLGAPRRS